MQELKSLSQFNKLKTTTPLIIIDFYATWCGPCKAISPVFSRIASTHTSNANILFLKCDVDKAKDVSQACGITAMPTFQFFKGGQKVDEVKGADVQQLTTKIGYYSAGIGKESASSSGSAQGGKKAEEEKSGPMSLRSLIDVQQARFVNASNLSSAKNIASPPPAGYTAASASGSRLLIHIPFTQTVNPTQLKITVASNSTLNAPSRIQIGTNIPVRITKSPEGIESHDLDMDSLSKAEGSQSFNVFSDEYINGTAELKLKVSKFTGIKSMTIRIDANLSGEEKTVSKIQVMDIIGSKA